MATIIVNITPELKYAQETYHSLAFGKTAGKAKKQVKDNTKFSYNDLITLVQKLKKENQEKDVKIKELEDLLRVNNISTTPKSKKSVGLDDTKEDWINTSINLADLGFFKRAVGTNFMDISILKNETSSFNILGEDDSFTSQNLNPETTILIEEDDKEHLLELDPEEKEFIVPMNQIPTIQEVDREHIITGLETEPDQNLQFVSSKGIKNMLNSIMKDWENELNIIPEVNTSFTMDIEQFKSDFIESAEIQNDIEVKLNEQLENARFENDDLKEHVKKLQIMQLDFENL